MYFQLNVESESPKVMASPAWRINHETHTRRETGARVRGYTRVAVRGTGGPLDPQSPKHRGSFVFLVRLCRHEGGRLN